MKDTIKTYFQPAFLICVIILLISAAGMSVAIKSFGMYLKKEPLPLKKSLDLLDQNGLGTYKIVSKEKIENKDILKALGTEDYIEWVLGRPGGFSGQPRAAMHAFYYLLFRFLTVCRMCRKNVIPAAAIRSCRPKF